MKENRTLGKVIADFRRLKKIPQRKMAIDTRIPLRHIRRIESINNTFDKELLKKDIELIKTIADYLEIPISAIFFSLLTREDYKNPENKNFFDIAKPIIDELLYFLLGVTKPINEVKIKKNDINEN